MAQILVAVMRTVDRRFQPGRKEEGGMNFLTGNTREIFPR